MRKIKQILRLKLACNLSHRQIARSTGVGKGTVADYLLRARTAGLSWESVEGMDEAELERRLLAPRQPEVASRRPIPDWSELHQELKRKGVTLALLWQEYKSDSPEGYQYSRFCELYRSWERTVDVCLRQEHKAGEKLFVDYCGQTVDVVNPSSGEVKPVQVFVAVLGASNFTYAEATWSQQLENWIGSHCRAFDFFGGVPELVIPDNLLSGVSKACRYEPELNPTYAEMVAHYGTAVLPARVRKPRDKAKVEAGVQVVQRWVLARLRKQSFFSLAELNREIRVLLDELNDRPLKRLGISRRELFEKLDRPALKPLPPVPYEFAQWKKARVNIDYHVEVNRHFYSVPYQLVRKELDIRVTVRTVECFHRGKRVASHPLSWSRGAHTTVREHMPKAHQAYVEWTPQRLVRWAAETGPATRDVVEAILSSRPHPQQGFRSCLGLLRLGKSYGTDRLEAACRRALAIQSASYKSVKSILSTGLDQQPLPLDEAANPPGIEHSNIRGAAYYNGVEQEEPTC